MDFLSCLLVLFSIICTCILLLILKSNHHKSAKLPPGPYPFPIIGNILELGQLNPHQSLAKLSQTYGPLMSLKIGCINMIVVSSPEIAKTVLQKHYHTFSNRTLAEVVKFVKHDKYSMAWLPVENPQWRKLRKITKEHMFSVQKLDASQGLRQEKLQKLHDYINQCCISGEIVNIGEAAFTTSLNLMSSTLFSVDLANFNSESSHEFKDVAWHVMKCIGTPNLADYFPLLRYVDPQGLSRDTKFYFGKLFSIFDSIIDQRLKSRGMYEKIDLLEVLLDLSHKDEPELSRNDINHLLLDLFVGGSDTTPVTVEWAMTQLLRNPEKMLKAQSELRELIGTDGILREYHISRLPYLQAVVKEAMRLHPVAPLLVPRKAETDVEINGYTVPENAQIIFNVWASGRDSNTWPNPDSFMPERFLDSKINYQGQDFELIPFGAGKRICPGLPLAHRMVHLMLATLIHNFSWKLEEGLKPEEIDMGENFGNTLHKAIPLKGFPIKL